MEEKSDISLIINRSSIAPQSLDIETDVSNYYSQYMDTLGITNLSWYIFILISLLQWIWGSESCFISINMDFLGQKDNISNKSISICICILYSMMGVGAALVGILCKYMGRIYTLNLTLFIYVVITFCCSVFFSPLKFYPIFFLRCISNIAIGIFNIAGLNLMTEFLPTKNRSLIIMINQGFYNIGNLFTIILDNSMLNLNEFNSKNWKYINFITIIPGVISLIIICLYGSESPLYLLNKNNKERGFIVIEFMSGKILSDNEKIRIMESIQRNKNYKLKSQYSELFTTDYRFLTITTLLICSICYLNLIGITYLIPKTLIDYKDKIYNISYNTQILIYGIIQIPNGIIGGLMTESTLFGRKKTILVSGFGCVIFYILSIILIKYIAIFTGMIMLFNSICYGCSFMYVTEIFPTNLRDLAQSFIQMFSFFLGSWSPFLVGILNHYFCYCALGITNIVIMFLAILLPVDTLLRPLDEDF
jgi:fucose permease